MSIKIESCSTKETLDVSPNTLGHLFRIARRYGWHDKRKGDDFEIIKPKSGRQLSEALRRAIDDLSQDTRLQVWTNLTPELLNTAADFFNKGKVVIY